MANKVKVIEIAGSLEEVETAIQTAIDALDPAPVADSDILITSDGGTHYQRIILSYRTA